MKSFLRKIFLSIGITVGVYIGYIAVVSLMIYLQASSHAKEGVGSSGDTDFYEQVKKAMGDNPNNDHLSLFQAMQKVMAEKRLAEKNKITDPNDPRSDPRLKYYFGHSLEMSPVPAVINYGGLTMKVQANELISSTLDASPISGRQTTQLSFRFEYPKMTGRTTDNIDDFLVPIITNKKRIWLDINTEPACLDERNVEVVSDDLHEIADYFSKFDKKFREFLLKNKSCSAKNTFDIDYSVFGNKNYYVQHAVLPYSKHPTWKEPFVYPDVSEYYKMDNLILEGYDTQGLGDNKTYVINERVYKYIPSNAKADEYEFITCHSNPPIMSKKFPKIKFNKETAYASCTHYFLLKNRIIMKVNYSEKYFKQHWQGIRDAVVRHFDSRITAVDDYVPQFYTKTKHGYQAVSHKRIDDLIKQNPIQATN